MPRRLARGAAAALLVLLLLAPSAQALVVISVDSQQYVERVFPTPFSDTYSFSLAGTIFDQPIYRAGVAFSYDFGEVTRNRVVHVETNYTLQGAAAYTVYAHLKSYGEKDWAGTSRMETRVYVNGTEAWAPKAERVGVAGMTFDYEQTHMIQYGENLTARVPASTLNGVAVWDWPSAPAICQGCSNEAGRAFVEVDGVTGWFWIPPEYAARAFAADNDTLQAPRYWLANGTNARTWSAANAYPDRIPETLTLSYQFDEQASFFVDVSREEDSCGGIARVFLNLVGICPSLTGIARWTIGLIPNILAFFLDFIHPSAGDALRTVGDLAGEFVASYIYLLSLATVSPGRLFVVTIATGSGLAWLAGGLRGDFQSILSLHVVIFKGLAIGVFWYFYVYWLLVKWIAEKIIQIVQAIGGYIPFT